MGASPPGGGAWAHVNCVQSKEFVNKNAGVVNVIDDPSFLDISKRARDNIGNTVGVSGHASLGVIIEYVVGLMCNTFPNQWLEVMKAFADHTDASIEDPEMLAIIKAVFPLQ